MDYAKQQAILKATLRQPTAHLSESEAYERVQALKLTCPLGGNGGHDATPKGPVGEAFTRDWQDMMEREREWN